MEEVEDVEEVEESDEAILEEFSKRYWAQILAEEITEEIVVEIVAEEEEIVAKIVMEKEETVTKNVAEEATVEMVEIRTLYFCKQFLHSETCGSCLPVTSVIYSSTFRPSGLFSFASSFLFLLFLLLLSARDLLFIILQRIDIQGEASPTISCLIVVFCVTACGTL